MQCAHLGLPSVDHRLDGEGLARRHDADRLVLGIMRDVGRGVEEVIDAVPRVRADDRASTIQ